MKFELGQMTELYTEGKKKDRLYLRSSAFIDFSVDLIIYFMKFCSIFAISEGIANNVKISCMSDLKNQIVGVLFKLKIYGGFFHPQRGKTHK